MGRQEWGEVRAIVREGEGTGIRQRKAYLLDFTPGPSLRQEPAGSVPFCPWPQGGKDRVLGLSREDGKRGAE